MRQITTKDNEEKKKKKKQLWIGIILIAIMFLSTIGYAIQSMSNTNEISKKIEYNGYEFIQNGEYWTANIKNNELFFRYNPKEIPKINSNIDKISSYSNYPLYIYTTNEEIYYELYRNFLPFVERVQRGCLKGEDCENLPAKTCDDKLIVVKYSENIDIKQNNSCVFIYTPIENSTMIVDEFLFKILNVEQ